MAKWETVVDGSVDITDITERLKVPGGWLVWRYITCFDVDNGTRISTSMAFVADPNHKWDISQKEEGV